MARSVCSIPDCGRSCKGHGFCERHYDRFCRWGDPLGGGPEQIRGDDVARFWSMVAEGENGCWVWTRGLNVGYGRVRMGGRAVLAHRWAYESLRAEIPDGLHLDHLCRNPPCVNPWHLEPVTLQENFRRSPLTTHGKTECKRGHPFDEVNTRFYKGGRWCRECERQRGRARLAALALGSG